jgi:hypothetical protein
MLTKVFIKSVGSTAESLHERLHHALSESGVGFSDQSSIEPVDAGILLFDIINTSIIDYILKHSQHTSGRLLCLAVKPEMLSVEETWSLLEAGAADVWTCSEISNQLIRQLTERVERWNTVDQILGSPLVRNNLVGESPVWKSCLRQGAIHLQGLLKPSLMEFGQLLRLPAGYIHHPNQRSPLQCCRTVIKQ